MSSFGLPDRCSSMSRHIRSGPYCVSPSPKIWVFGFFVLGLKLLQCFNHITNYGRPPGQQHSGQSCMTTWLQHYQWLTIDPMVLPLMTFNCILYIYMLPSVYHDLTICHLVAFNFLWLIQRIHWSTCVFHSCVITSKSTIQSSSTCSLK